MNKITAAKDSPVIQNVKLMVSSICSSWTEWRPPPWAQYMEQHRSDGNQYEDYRYGHHSPSLPSMAGNARDRALQVICDQRWPRPRSTRTADAPSGIAVPPLARQKPRPTPCRGTSRRFTSSTIPDPGAENVDGLALFVNQRRAARTAAQRRSVEWRCQGRWGRTQPAAAGPTWRLGTHSGCSTRNKDFAWRSEYATCRLAARP